MPKASLLLKTLLFAIFFSLIFSPKVATPVFAADPNCAENAPGFLKFDPSSQIKKGDPLKAIFEAPPTPPDPNRKPKYLFFIKGKAAVVGEIDANNPPSDWTINLGTPDKSASMEWFISFKRSSSNSFLSIKCGSYSFEVCPTGGCSYTGSLGKNPCTGGKCETGLGDIPTNPQAFASKILTIAVGLAGGFALILMVIGSIRVLTSSGDQQKLSGGRDQIVAAIAGLLFLIFSVLILRFIGIQILGL